MILSTVVLLSMLILTEYSKTNIYSANIYYDPGTR